MIPIHLRDIVRVVLSWSIHTPQAAISIVLRPGLRPGDRIDVPISAAGMTADEVAAAWSAILRASDPNGGRHDA